jgi:hypothetical protein
VSRFAALACALAAACSRAPELALAIRLPADQRGLAAVTRVNLSAARDGVPLAQASFPATATTVSLSGITHGPRTVITLDGVDSSSAVIARGRTCPIDFEASGMSAPLYFAPTNFFAPTAGAPTIVRQHPIALALTDGTVLIAGGADPSGAVLSSSEWFAPGAATFSAGAVTLAHARWRAEAVELSAIGLVLITGGVGPDGSALADGELYDEGQEQLLALADPLLDRRVGHRVVVLGDGRALLTGGAATDGGAPLTTTLVIYVLSDGTYQVSAGPQLVEARREHAATVAVGIPILFGGYGASGAPLDSVEAVDPASASTTVAHLAHARAGATASLLGDGSVLLVGGVGADGAPLGNAELFNPVTRSTTVYAMAAARRGHTATVLADGRVLVAGGLDASGAPIASVELFAEGVGFLTERSLGSARGGHAAVPLCDGTVLIVGAVDGAELYSEPAN